MPGLGMSGVVWSMIVHNVYGVQEDYRTIRVPEGAAGRSLKLGKLAVALPGRARRRGHVGLRPERPRGLRRRDGRGPAPGDGRRRAVAGGRLRQRRALSRQGRGDLPCRTQPTAVRCDIGGGVGVRCEERRAVDSLAPGAGRSGGAVAAGVLTARGERPRVGRGHSRHGIRDPGNGPGRGGARRRRPRPLLPARAEGPRRPVRPEQLRPPPDEPRRRRPDRGLPRGPPAPAGDLLGLAPALGRRRAPRRRLDPGGLHHRRGSGRDAREPTASPASRPR